MTDVVIAGGGPTGLMLACELRLAGVDVTVLDRLPGRRGESRAGGLHARTLEVLDQRGVADRFLTPGRPRNVGHFSGLWLDFSRLPTRYPFVLNLLQTQVEQLLEQWAAELGVRVRWSSEVTGVRQAADGVEVAVADGTTFDAAYLAGCDGGRSTVRRLAGIEFPGTPATLTALLGDVELTDPPGEPVFMRRTEHGDFSVLGFEPGWYRVMTTEYDRVAGRDEPVTADRLRESLVKIAGTDFGMHSPRWISRYGDAARQAADYRRGRVLLAGDAAHIHYPAGGQGLNTGVQDAVNLGWKLAAVVRGHAPESLLDTYHAERHPVGHRVLHNTRAQTALGRPGAQTEALREVFAGLIEIDDVNSALAGMISALDVRYPLGDADPLLGRRVPDLDLVTERGAARLFTLLHPGRAVLLDLAGDPELAAVARSWPGRLDLVAAKCTQPVPDAVLIRPDGHVAWVAPQGAEALRAACTRWLGQGR
ncbi:FAD-dependent monooxygenase [Amycolatopsis thermalba]|uniref:FAD-dependent monooxygenase n=1 Tax=Amycolatopsis thermalba TaxID=944492 RepID=UPI000E25BA6C|nr:FAD-dependent monooxygenase [Amycolatopsis thermalba]